MVQCLEDFVDQAGLGSSKRRELKRKNTKGFKGFGGSGGFRGFWGGFNLEV